MRAIAANRYGDNNVLNVADVEDPRLAPDTIIARPPGHAVLVEGASGGVGSFAVQLAASTGARVIGAASPANHDYLRGLGAEPVAYGRRLVDEVLALAPEGVDAVIDLFGGAGLDAVPALLKPGGQLVGTADALPLKELGGRYVFVQPDAAQLTDLGQLAAKGDLSVHVSAEFAFYHAVSGFDPVESGPPPRK